MAEHFSPDPATSSGFNLSYENRFGGLGRLVGEDGLASLRTARVAVVGLGGVGSWAAEALARSGIGRLALIDLDDSCVTNTNRQVHALDGNYGLSKAETLAARFRLINPELVISVIQDFVTPRTVKQYLDSSLDASLDYVIDATDSVPDKAVMYLHCRELGIPLAMCGASGGKLEPCRITTSDLGQEHADALLKSVKRRLKKHHSFEPGVWDSGRFRGMEHWGVEAVWSEEPTAKPWETCAARAPDPGARIDCASGYGAAGFVTGAFGFALASLAVRCLARGHRLHGND